MSIQLQALSKQYDQSVLENIDLEIKTGDFVAIMGPSGAGKSTLVKQLALIELPSSGNYLLDGVNLSLATVDERSQLIRRTIAYVDQSLFLYDSLTVYENISLGLNIAQMKIDSVAIANMASKLKVEHLLTKYPCELSGGERQRIIICQNLLKQPKLIVLDEPTSALDYQASHELMQLLTAFQSELSTTIILVTHNSAMAKYSKRTIFLKDGRVYNNVYHLDHNYEQEIIACNSSMYGGNNA